MFALHLALLFFVTVQCAEVPPNIGQTQYSINLFRGNTPHEQRLNSIGSQLFDLTNTNTNDDIGVYIKYDQISEINRIANCYYQEKSSKVSWSSSSTTLKRQSTSTSNGYDQESTIGVEYKGVTAETSIRNALIFGNSRTSKTQHSEQLSGFTYSVDASSSRSLYSIEIDWDNFNTDDWNNNFKNAISSLGASPSINQILNFFDDYGTHGLLTATFGQICTGSIFIEEGSSKTAYETFNSQTSSNTAGLLWWTSTSSSEMSESNTQTYGSLFNYKFDNRYCYGELDYTSSCGGVMNAGGLNSPAITRWTYKPIWEMNIPGFSDTARAKMIEVAEDIYLSGVNCRNNFCNGNGYCGPSELFWSTTNINLNTNNYDSLWNGNKCFCDDTYRGINCNLDALLELRDDGWTGYINNWDAVLDYEAPNAICGIKGVHDNGREDRRYGFRKCRPVSTSYDTRVGAVTIYQRTDYDGGFWIECEDDKVLIGLHSYHDNGREDREWRFECQKLEKTTTVDCVWDTNYRNDWDAYFEETCPEGKIIHGLHSYHDNGREDRRWKFQCCQLSIENTNYRAIVKTGWSSYVNNWDSSHYTDLVSSNRVFCGMSGYHDNGREDRRYRFKYCYPTPNSGLTSITGWSAYTGWDASWTYSCSSSNSFIAGIRSYHNNGREDRVFSFRCAAFNGAITGDCTWTPYVNEWDSYYDFECGSGYAINGMASYHDNGREDRRWKYRCCRISIID